ncbi:MAG: hypothetical protein H6739_42285, partial [Alphaproteobacteria bacterium]|nr:hypothetical protein [Alphaproteobacteria bacterium]
MTLPPLLALLAACSGRDPAAAEDRDESDPIDVTEGPLLLRGAEVVGQGVVDVAVRDGAIEAVGEGLSGGEVVDLTGRWLVPAFIDSHVHLAYYPVGDALLDGGVAGAVDLAAPERWLAEDLGPLRLRRSGPMVTAEGGYPTQGWGRDGYGLPCADAEAAAAAVDHLAEAGVQVLKLPVTGPPVLDEAALRAAVERAHARGLPVASHALGDDEARLAGAVGADLLAHTPTAGLSSETLALWADRAVITTLGAFGGSG